MPFDQSQIIKWPHQKKKRFSFLCITALYELYMFMYAHQLSVWRAVLHAGPYAKSPAPVFLFHLNHPVRIWGPFVAHFRKEDAKAH